MNKSSLNILFKISAVLVCLAVFQSCGDSRNAGGSSGHENVITAKVNLDSDSFATVQVVAGENWQELVEKRSSVILEETTTDSTGFFELDSLWLNGEYNLYIHTQSGKSRLFRRAQSSLSETEIELSRRELNLESGNLESGDWKIWGTPISFRVENNGSVFLQGLPNDVLILGRHRDSVWNTARVVDARRETVETYVYEPQASLIENVSEPVVLVDDFNEPRNFSFIQSINGGGYWWVADDQDQGGFSAVEPAAVYSDMSQGVVADGAYEGSSLYLQFDVDESFLNNYVLVGFDLGLPINESESLDRLGVGVFKDISELRQISFQAKSDADSLQMALSAGCLNADSSKVVYFEIPFFTATEWTEVALDADDFMPVEGTGAGTLSWSEVRHACKSLAFRARSDGGVHLDNILLRGIGIWDLF
jgi:hypothetical protein